MDDYDLYEGLQPANAVISVPQRQEAVPPCLPRPPAQQQIVLAQQQGSGAATAVLAFQDAEVKRLRQELKELQQQLTTAQNNHKDAIDKAAKLEEERSVLVRNISVLYRTAVCEIQRKNQEIQNLRASRVSGNDMSTPPPKNIGPASGVKQIQPGSYHGSERQVHRSRSPYDNSQAVNQPNLTGHDRQKSPSPVNNDHQSNSHTGDANKKRDSNSQVKDSSGNEGHQHKRQRIDEANKHENHRSEYRPQQHTTDRHRQDTRPIGGSGKRDSSSGHENRHAAYSRHHSSAGQQDSNRRPLQAHEQQGSRHQRYGQQAGTTPATSQERRSTNHKGHSYQHVPADSHVTGRTHVGRPDSHSTRQYGSSKDVQRQGNTESQRSRSPLHIVQ